MHRVRPSRRAVVFGAVALLLTLLTARWLLLREDGAERPHVGRAAPQREDAELAAQEFASWVRESSVFELAAPAPLNLVCFRHLGGDSVNQHIMDNLNQNGQMYLTHTRLNDRLALRLCVGQTHTEPRHVQAAWESIQEAAREFEK